MKQTCDGVTGDESGEYGLINFCLRKRERDDGGDPHFITYSVKPAERHTYIMYKQTVS